MISNNKFTDKITLNNKIVQKYLIIKNSVKSEFSNSIIQGNNVSDQQLIVI